MSTWSEQKHRTPVLDLSMTHVEMGSGAGNGAPVVLLHGNPTSSFLWRNVMAAMPEAGRLLAPDLIGMGDSDKLPDPGAARYTLAEHARYLDAWFDVVVPEGPVTLVLHDWGGPLGFRWARLNAERVHAIAYMETVLRPMDWSEWPEPSTAIFQALRSEAGEDMILQKNIFVERILTGSILRDLSADEMAEYRRPFAAPGEDRRPTLTWPRQIPLDGEPAESLAIIQANWDWLRTWDGPKLLVDADPGAIMKGTILDDARALSNQTEVQVPGIHFIQEDSGAQIGAAIADWLRKIS
ncbi:MAG: haloalkane dehalogenase [Pseudomonadota bacterium]